MALQSSSERTIPVIFWLFLKRSFTVQKEDRSKQTEYQDYKKCDSQQRAEEVTRRVQDQSLKAQIAGERNFDLTLKQEANVSVVEYATRCTSQPSFALCTPEEHTVQYQYDEWKQ